MTSAPQPSGVRPAPARTPRDAFAALRAQGLRLSSARRALLVALVESDAPLTAEEVAERAAGDVGRADIASTYRNLDVLEREGLVHHVHVGHGPGRYRYAGGEPVDFLACEACGDVLALPPAALDDVRGALRERFAFDARFSHFPITGRCARCAC